MGKVIDGTLGLDSMFLPCNPFFPAFEVLVFSVGMAVFFDTCDVSADLIFLFFLRPASSYSVLGSSRRFSSVDVSSIMLLGVATGLGTTLEVCAGGETTSQCMLKLGFQAIA